MFVVSSFLNLLYRSQPKVLALADEVGVKTQRQYLAGKKILMFPDGNKKLYDKPIPPVNLMGLLKMNRLFGKVSFRPCIVCMVI